VAFFLYLPKIDRWQKKTLLINLKRKKKESSPLTPPPLSFQ